MIFSFKCKDTEKIFNREYSKKFPNNLQRIALRKLRMLHRASVLKDLTVPPGNYLEKLRGDRIGQYSRSSSAVSLVKEAGGSLPF